MHKERRQAIKGLTPNFQAMFCFLYSENVLILKLSKCVVIKYASKMLNMNILKFLSQTHILCLSVSFSRLNHWKDLINVSTEIGKNLDRGLHFFY